MQEKRTRAPTPSPNMRFYRTVFISTHTQNTSFGGEGGSLNHVPPGTEFSRRCMPRSRQEELQSPSNA